MIRTKLTHLLSLSFFLFFANQLSAQNLGVHPTTLTFRLTRGQNETQTIHLSNNSPKKIQFRMYLNDWMRDSTGGHFYVDPTKDSLNGKPFYDPYIALHSCSKWVTTDRNFIEIEPGKSADLSVKLTVPDSATVTDEMKWSMLFIETVEEQNNNLPKGSQAAVRNLLRIGVHIYQTPPNLTEKSVKAIDLTPSPTAKNTYRLLCQNTGKVMVDCKSYLELADLTSGAKTKLDPVEFPMFPGQKRYVSFEIPKTVVKGKYSALGVLDAGEDLSLEAVESEIEIK